MKAARPTHHISRGLMQPCGHAAGLRAGPEAVLSCPATARDARGEVGRGAIPLLTCPNSPGLTPRSGLRQATPRSWHLALPLALLARWPFGEIWGEKHENAAWSLRQGKGPGGFHAPLGPLWQERSLGKCQTNHNTQKKAPLSFSFVVLRLISDAKLFAHPLPNVFPLYE